MIIVLGLACLLLIPLIYLCNGRRLVSVSFITSVSFFVSAWLYIINYKYFSRDISFRTVLIIIGSILPMILGEIAGLFISVKKKPAPPRVIPEKNDDGTLDGKGVRLFILLAVCLVFSVLKLLDLRNYAYRTGFGGNIFALTQFMRHYVTTNEYEPPTMIAYGSVFVETAAYYLFFVFFENLFLHKRSDFRCLLILPIHIINCFASTGRSELVAFLSFALVLLVHFNSKIIHSLKRKTKRLMIVIAAGFTVFFYAFGKLRGGESNLNGLLASYASSSLIGLDNYCESFMRSDYFGCLLFKDVRRYFSLVFGSLPDADTGFAKATLFPVYYWNSELGAQVSNIYTCLALPLADLGIGGMLVSRFVIGLIFGVFEKSARFKTIAYRNAIPIILICILFYCPVTSSIADRYVLFISIRILKYSVFLILIKMLFRKNRGADKGKHLLLENQP